MVRDQTFPLLLYSTFILTSVLRLTWDNYLIRILAQITSVAVTTLLNYVYRKLMINEYFCILFLPRFLVTIERSEEGSTFSAPQISNGRIRTVFLHC